MKEFEKIIEEYLTDFAKKDNCFAAKFNNPNKTIAECCKYIICEAQKKANGKEAIGMSDDEVYYLARHYYEEDIKFNESNAKVVVKNINLNRDVTSKPKKAKAEKKEDQLNLFDFAYED